MAMSSEKLHRQDTYFCNERSKNTYLVNIHMVKRSKKQKLLHFELVSKDML